MRSLFRAAAGGALLLAGCAAAPDAAPLTGAPPAPVTEEPRPFDARADAMAEVDVALARARVNGGHALLVLGGNWCHDSRGLAWKLGEPELKAIIDANYELVFVDVGHRDANLDIPRRFGVTELIGTPTVLIIDGDGQLANADSVSDWTNAASRSMAETVAYFSRWTKSASE